jgi:CDP-diacylglycerol--glycerol-3-phosphate 3-phosphatidyltransferase
MNIANFVTSIRLLSLAPLVWSLVANSPNGAWICLFWYLFAGATDVLDGFLARRLGLVSKTGAMLDLLADRLLTLCVFIGLIYRGDADVWVLVAGVILVGRDFLVAGLNETYPNQLKIQVSVLERIKVTAQFVGFGFLISPYFEFANLKFGSHEFGQAALIMSAVLCTFTILDYVKRAAKIGRT